MAKTMTDDMFLIQCEKIVNETWSKASRYYDEMKAIMDKGGPENEYEQTIVMIGFNAAVQKMTLDKAQDQRFFELPAEKSECGENLKTDCPCDRDVCLMKI